MELAVTRLHGLRAPAPHAGRASPAAGEDGDRICVIAATTARGWALRLPRGGDDPDRVFFEARW